jgi:hypothetical protein
MTGADIDASFDFGVSSSSAALTQAFRPERRR